MKTAKQREEDFRRDLAELLACHDAELTVTDDGKVYGMHSGVCLISMQSEWNKDGDILAEYTEFQL